MLCDFILNYVSSLISYPYKNTDLQRDIQLFMYNFIYKIAQFSVKIRQ